MKARAARFWELLNGSPVRIALRPGDCRRWHHWEPTDEGWHSESIEWTHHGTHVERGIITDGADCDGRLMQFSHCRAELDRLDANRPESLPVPFPDWHPIESGQRDYAAEAAGY